MGLFGKSFEEKVQEVLKEIRAAEPGVKNLSAQLDGKVVTLTGTAPSREVRSRVMQAFIAKAEPDNTVNRMVVEEAKAPEPAAAAEQAATERIHTVVAGDTLSGIAKKYYGNAGLYMKIFEANKDQLSNPDLIKVGQKLRIPM